MKTLSNPSDLGILNVLQERMNRLFGDLLGEGYERPEGLEIWSPRADVYETDDALEVQLDVPGIAPSNLDTSIRGHYLEVTGERPANSTASENRWYHFERPCGRFYWRLSLPVPVDPDQIQARMTNGVLSLHLPKRAEGKARHISVRTR